MENKITFDFGAANRTEKESIEWLRLWCENANDKTLPRVALVGDSITEGYFRFVQSSLKGIANVDYLATSYSVNTVSFKRAVGCYLSDSDYDIIHFNNGLHGYQVTEEEYESSIEDLLVNYKDKSKIILANVTDVYINELKDLNPEWAVKVAERNAAVLRLAKKYGWGISDMYSAMAVIPKSDRNIDGVHFTENGYKVLADIAVRSIKEKL